MWETNSTDGWQVVKWSPQYVDAVEGMLVAFTELRLCGQHWDPLRLETASDYFLAPHYECVLPCVVLSIEHLEVLLQHLESPEHVEAGFNIFLSPKKQDQSLELTIGEREEFGSRNGDAASY